MARFTWPQRIVESLRDSKSAGFTFDAAWCIAERGVIIPASDTGGHQPTLFDADGTQYTEESVYSFFRRACEAAYTDSVDALGSGNGRPVRHFGRGLLDDTHDDAHAGVVPLAA